MAEAIMPQMEAPPPLEEPVVQLPEHQQQEEEEQEQGLNNAAPLQMIIDSDLEDEEQQAEAHFKRNGGLPYDDHNYGNLEKKRVKGKDSDDERDFPSIGPLDEFLNILPTTPPQPVYHQPQPQPQQQSQPQHVQTQQIFLHQRAGSAHLPKQYTAQFIPEHQRSEPAIVARAPAREGGMPYRLHAETASGYQPVRTILPQSRPIMRPRAELSQSGQPVYVQSAAHHAPGNLRATPTTTTAVGTIPRRPPQQQQQQLQQHQQQPQQQQQQPGQPGAYQHIANSTPAGQLIRRSIPTGRGPSILAANRASVAAGDHFSPQTSVQRRVVDVAPHRMTQEQRILQQQQVAAHTRPLTVTNTTQSPSTQFTNLEGVAPMLVPARGSKLLVRGRAGSHGQRRREDGGDFQSPPPSSSDSGSPRKLMVGDASPAEESHLLSPSKLAAFGAVKPPHRMTQEEKNAHIAKHLEKDKIPAVPMSAAAQAILENTTRSTDENVASVVLAVAEAVNAANMNSGEARPSNHPTPSTSTTSYHLPASNVQVVDKKEKEEITKLANDLRMSCESFDQKTPQVQHQNGDSVQQSDGMSKNSAPFSVVAVVAATEMTAAKTKVSDVIRVKHHIENAKRALEEEANTVGPGGKGDGRKQRSSGYGANMMAMGTPDQPARQRGRPKGSTGARNRWSTSSNQQEAPTPPGNVVRLGQGVRTMPAQLPPSHLHQMQQGQVLVPHQSPIRIPPPPLQQQHQQQQQLVVEKDSDSESDGINKQGENDYGDSWTMRCHCGMDHGDGDCVECEKCGDWQHMACMGLKQGDPLDGYQCEVCVPRHLKLSRAEAAKIQRKILEKIKANKPKPEKRGRKSQSKETGKRRSSTNKTPTSLYADANEYSRTSLRLLKTLSSTSGAAGLLMEAKNKIRAKRMFVLENVEGLVSVEPVDPREVIIELVGYVCRVDEANREPGGVPGIYQYDGLLKGPQGEDVGESTGNELLCVDTKKKGNDSKYTRRSCVPNCVLKHVLDERGILGVMIVATRFVAYNTEITLPFDNDWTVRKTKLVCAEHFGEESTMCPYEMERARRNPPELVPTQPRMRPDAFEHILRAEGEDDEKYDEPVRRVEKPAKASRKSEKVEPVAPKKVDKVVEVAKKVEPKKEEVEEDEKKEELKAKMTPGSSKKAQKAAKRASMEMSPPAQNKVAPKEESEKKLSREERRTQQYEKLFSRQEEEEKRRQSKSNKKESKTPTPAEREKSKSVEKERTPAPATEKRTSARVSAAASKTAESTPTRELSARQKDKKKRLESEAESEASSMPVPPVKRWKAEAAKEAAVAPSFKKQWVKRHNAENVASSSSPTKKSRRTSVEQPKFTYLDVYNVIRENARQVAKVQMDFDISHIRTKDDKVSRKCLQVQEEFKRQADEKERRQRREKRESEREEAEKKAEQEEIKQEVIDKEVKEEEEEVEATTSTVEKVEEVEEAKKVTRKRLSMAEYKMRKPTVGQSESKDDQKPSSSQGVGFIPSTEGASGQTISFPLLPPLVAQTSPDKRHYYNQPSTSSGDPRLRHHAPLPPPPPPRAPQTPPTASPSRFAGASFTTSADDSPQHTMSLKARLFSEFGVGQQEETPAPSAPPAQPSTRTRSTRWQ